jgi:3-hydroxyisobutyrate dehydrogenase
MASTIGSIAVLGTGTMGLPIARNLARAGLYVSAWDRTPERVAPLRDEGVTVAPDPADAVRGRDALLTMLSDADAVTSVAEQALPAARDDTIWIQLSTIGLAGTERCVALADQHGVALVDSPVLGTKGPAEQGQLTVLASGPEQALDRCAAVFDAIGQRTLRAGPTGAGTRLKLVANEWIVALVESAAESLALAEGLGVDPRMFLQAIEGGPLDLPYLHAKADMMLKRSFEPPQFSLRLAAKDAALVVEAAEREGLDLPVARAIAQRLAEGAQEHGDEDLAATFRTSAPTTGRR